jgi:hypothetical protein
MWKGLLLAMNIVAVLVILALGFHVFVQPRLVIAMYGQRYMDLIFKCDNVMREHLIAKNRMLNEANDDSVKALKAAEVGLIECHDYDKMRKDLIGLGLTDNDLAKLGLKAIEEREADVREFVKVHQIKY